MSEKNTKKWNIWNLFKNFGKNLKINNKFKNEALGKAKNINKPNDDEVISLQHVSKIFKNISGAPFKVLDDVSFSVRKGEFHGFIGNNGAGKTTTIRLILNYYQDRFGKIYINGIDSKNKNAKNKIGYIPEISVFPKNLTIYEYLYYFARLSRLNKIEAKNKINNLLEKYGFNSEMFHKSAEKLSSGQKKKILLIQALINDPEILIMDEPAANLDPSARLEFFDAINELHKEGKTIFMSSHILSELEKYIDSFTILENGRVKDTGKICEKLANLEYKYVLSTSNNEKAHEIVKQLKFKCLFSNDKIYINIKDLNDKKRLFNAFFDNKIDVISFKQNVKSLNQIYFNN